MFDTYSDVVNIRDLQAMLSIGRDSAYRLIQTKVIPCIRIGKQYRIPKKFVIDYLLSAN